MAPELRSHDLVLPEHITYPTPPMLVAPCCARVVSLEIPLAWFQLRSCLPVLRTRQTPSKRLAMIISTSWAPTHIFTTFGCRSAGRKQQHDMSVTGANGTSPPRHGAHHRGRHCAPVDSTHSGRHYLSSILQSRHSGPC